MLGSPGRVLAGSVGTRNVWEFEEDDQGEAGRKERNTGRSQAASGRKKPDRFGMGSVCCPARRV